MISGIIFRSLDKGNFNFINFYTRRVCRIFPSLIITLLASFIIGWLTLFFNEFKQLCKYIIGRSIFIDNFIALNETGYFATSSELKPLLHLWSLGVEEQFYILWPFILWLSWKFRINLLCITLIIASISFYLNIKGMVLNPIESFFSPWTRFWELLSGAILAYINLHWEGVKPPSSISSHRFFHDAALHVRTHQLLINNSLAFTGLIILSYGIFNFSPQTPFPGIAALSPIIGTLLIIAGGDRSWINRVILSSRPIILLGLISYPLYLYHWILLAFVRIIFAGVPATGFLGSPIIFCTIALALTLSWLTYEYIERPIQKYKNSKKVSIFLISIIFSIGFSCAIFSRLNTTTLPDMLNEKTGNHSTLDSSWPENKNRNLNCIDRFPFSNYCTLQNIDLPPTIALVGDSHANHFAHGLSIDLESLHENLLNLGFPGCPPIIDVRGKTIDAKYCEENATKKMFDEVINSKTIHTIILAANWHLYINGGRLNHDGDGNFYHLSSEKVNSSNNQQVFAIQLQKTLNLLISSGKKIVLMKQIPELSFDPLNCQKNRFFEFLSQSKIRCAMPTEDAKKYLQEYELYLNPILSYFPSVQVWDPTSIICNELNCISNTGVVNLYRDPVHLSLAGSEFIGAGLVKKYLTSSK